jgi:hypothetical protein
VFVGQRYSALQRRAARSVCVCPTADADGMRAQREAAKIFSIRPLPGCGG